MVDLRSPEEYADDHLPGAINAPLFDDEERALVGTLYRQSSAEDAFDRGRELVAAKILDLVTRIGDVAGWPRPDGDLPALVQSMTAGGLARFEGALSERPERDLPERPVFLSCWRGGLRSRSVAAFLRLLGHEDVLCISGGYKSYRRAVMEALAGWQAAPTFVLRGLTGVGKTLVLRALEELRPGWTVDLEALAGHRSSILGMVGLEPCSQRQFESRLASRLEARAVQRPLVLEGESRKVGDAIVPAALWSALEGGTSIELIAPVERRIDVLIEDYLAREESRAELRRRLPFLEQRLGARRWNGELVAMLDQGKERELVEVLLERYYDPLYRHSEKGRVYAATIDSTEPRRAAAEVARWVETRLSDVS